MTKVAAVLCVRMDSDRLPGKVLSVYDEASQKTNLELIIKRVKTSRYDPMLVVATGISSINDPIVDLCHKLNVPVGRYIESENRNVVSLFDRSLKDTITYCDYVWRVMADCPLVDVGLVDYRLDVLVRNQADVLTMLPPEPTYAAQASIWSKAAWDYCAKMSSGSLLEHPGEYIYENLGQLKSIRELGPENVYYQNIRTELDTKEDLEFFKQVWKLPHLFKTRSTSEILHRLEIHPEIVALNQHIQEKTHSTQLHGHNHARKFICKECETVLAVKINDALELQCPTCGTSRTFYP